MDNLSSDRQIQRPSHRYNILFNSYLRVFLVIISFTILGSFIVIGNNADLSTKTTTKGKYRNVYHGNTFTDKSYNYNDQPLFYLGAFIGLLTILTLSSYAFRKKYVINLEKNGILLKYGSERRKKIFKISLFLGFTGLDRLMMKRYFLALAKFLFSLWTFLILTAFLTVEKNFFLTSLSLITFTIFIFWWSIDVILIHSGTACEKHKIELE